MAKPRSYRTEAIVIRRSDFGEADRLLTLYGRETGKFRAIAKGARKPASRKTGHVELFSRTKFLVASGRDLDIITQAEITDPHRGLATDLVRSTTAAYVCELLDTLAPERESNTLLYDLLSNLLQEIADGDNLTVVTRYFEMKLLTISGFQPQLFTCVGTRELIEDEDQFFSISLGGFLKPSAQSLDPRARPVSASAVKLMRFLQTRPWSSVQNLHLRDSLLREVEQLMGAYLVYTLEKRPNSATFLNRLKSEFGFITKKTSE